MIFEYKCRICGTRKLTTERADTIGRCTNPDCNGELRRLFSFSTANVAPQTRFKEHLNSSTGLPTSSMHQHEENLRRLSEERTRATGIEHNYVPIDSRDREALGVSEHAEEHLRKNREQARKDKIDKLKGAA